MDDAKKGLFPGALEMMILQVLRRQPMHGYAPAPAES
jgi:DNA-binding PadR family transcriptional regulator